MMFMANEPHCMSLGRNGSIETYGIEVQRWYKAAGDTINLFPIRSNGVTGQCCIELPVSEIPALIAELQRRQNEN